MQLRPGPVNAHFASAARSVRDAALSVLLKITYLEVIAEGVKTAELLAMLRAAGVSQVQGHYFSPPLRADAFLHYYTHHN